MSSRLEKEKFKATQEKSQAILSTLLKDEDNKYCVDCDAKGPRWASWNLGIFLCIRCAGIHRNLGVHISKVKSVNLDTWTPEQISMMMEIGNSRARAVYEANIPDNFRRPQTDSSLESFIRAKYEHKKYIAREWVPPTPKVPKEFLEDDSKDKKRSKPKTGMIQLNATPKPKPSSSTSNGNLKRSPEAVKPSQPEAPKPVQPTENKASLDLLGLETPTHSSSNADLLGDLLGGPSPAQPTPSTDSVQGSNQTTPDQPLPNGTGAEESLMSETQTKSTKESILALYGSSSNSQQQFGVPGGVYMAQQGGPQQMYGGMQMMGQPQGMMGQPQGMMGQSQGMMGQPQGMMGQPQGMMGQSQGMMGQPQGMMGQPQGMMGQPQGMMGQPQGMVGMSQGMGVPQQGMMGPQQGMMGMQQPNMYNMMGGNSMMMQPGSGAQLPAYNQTQMPQYQQMQHQMASMKIGNSTGLGDGMSSNYRPSTLSNNLWQ